LNLILALLVYKIRIIAIGRIKEKYLLEGIQEYLKRIKPFCRIEIIELKEEGIEKEAKRLIKYVDENTFVLDAQVKMFSSEEFAEFLKKRGNCYLCHRRPRRYSRFD